MENKLEQKKEKHLLRLCFPSLFPVIIPRETYTVMFSFNGQRELTSSDCREPS